MARTTIATRVARLEEACRIPIRDRDDLIGYPVRLAMFRAALRQEAAIGGKGQAALAAKYLRLSDKLLVDVLLFERERRLAGRETVDDEWLQFWQGAYGREPEVVLPILRSWVRRGLLKEEDRE
jgi:hypothetical protein